MGVDIGTGASEGADTLASVEQERLPTAKRAPLPAGLGEVDLPQGDAAAVQEALAFDARQLSDGLVEATGLLELLRRPLLQVEPVAVVVERTSDAGALRRH